MLTRHLVAFSALCLFIDNSVLAGEAVRSPPSACRMKRMVRRNAQDVFTHDLANAATTVVTGSDSSTVLNSPGAGDEAVETGLSDSPFFDQSGGDDRTPKGHAKTTTVTATDTVQVTASSSAASSSTTSSHAANTLTSGAASSATLTPAAASSAAATVGSLVSQGPFIPVSAAVTPSSTPSPAPAQPSVAAKAAVSAPVKAFVLPGRQLQVAPVGIGVVAGLSAIALIVVGLVTYERKKYRNQYRQRKSKEGEVSPFTMKEAMGGGIVV